MMKKKSITFTFVLMVLCSVWINLITLNHGQYWGDDFAQYLIHAQNLLFHRDYPFTWHIGYGVVSPPLFPMMLTVPMALFGLNFLIFKIQNIIFWIGFVTVIFWMVRKTSGPSMALLVSGLFLFSANFFILKHHILTDIPFLFFVTSGIYLLTEYFEQTDRKASTSNMLFVAGMTLLFLSFFTRWAGALPIIATCIYLQLKEKNWLPSLIIILILGLSFMIQQALFGISLSDHFRELAQILDLGRNDAQPWLNIYLNHLKRIFISGLVFLFPFKTIITIPIFSIFIAISAFLCPIMFFLCYGYLANKAFQKEMTFLECFFGVYLTSLLVCVIPGEERYLFPIIGPFLIILVVAVQNADRHCFPTTERNGIFSKLLSTLLILLICHNLLSILLFRHYNEDRISQKSALELFTWIKNNTHPEDKLVFRKPRALGLMTHRFTTSYTHLTQGDGICHVIEKLPIKFLVYSDLNPQPFIEFRNLAYLPLKVMTVGGARFTPQPELSQILPEELAPCAFELKQVWDNGTYTIMKIVPEMEPS